MKTGNDFLDQVRRIEFGLVPLFLTLVSIDRSRDVYHCAPPCMQTVIMTQFCLFPLPLPRVRPPARQPRVTQFPPFLIDTKQSQSTICPADPLGTSCYPYIGHGDIHALRRRLPALAVRCSAGNPLAL